jgi:hypothetical protein
MTMRRGDEIALVTQTWGNEDQRWIGGGGEEVYPNRSIILDRSAFSLVGGTFPNGYIPSGVVLGKITAMGLYAPYLDTNSDGTEVAAGFLYTTVAYNRDAAATADIPATLFRGGIVITTYLPTGNGLDTNGRADLASRIIFETRV